MMRLKALAAGVLLAVAPLGAMAATTAASTLVGPPNTSPTGEFGTATAPVTMVVFADFACPYSSALFFTLEKIEAKYPQDLHVVFKQSPLAMHVDAPRLHRAALAAGKQGKFVAMAELLYANQLRQSEDDVFNYARQLHLDMVRFKRDYDSAAVAAQLNADMVESRAFGINETPTLYVNGHMLSGVQSEAVLDTAIKVAAAGAALAAAPKVEASHPVVDAALLKQIQTAPVAEMGNPNAALTIVEFTDFQCPFCRSSVEPMEQLMKARGRDVHWIIRSFPLDFHPDSELANEAALAAGEQGKFWEMHDLLFSHQEALKLGSLRIYAQQLSLDMNKFDEAIATHKFAGKIAADRALGNRVGVEGTPTFVIDGQLLVGARSLPELNQLADAHVRGVTAPSTEVAGVTVPAVDSAGVKVYGGDDSVLTLTWFTDVRSPVAARQVELVRAITERYGLRLKVMYKAFPMASREDSKLGGAALMAAAAQGRFWEMYDALAERRDVLDREKMMAVAATLHLDAASFGKAMDEAAPAVTADMDEAVRRGIQGAPVFFLKGQRVDGLQRKEFYMAILDEQLRQNAAQQASVAGPAK